MKSTFKLRMMKWKGKIKEAAGRLLRSETLVFRGMKESRIAALMLEEDDDAPRPAEHASMTEFNPREVMPRKAPGNGKRRSRIIRRRLSMEGRWQARRFRYPCQNCDGVWNPYRHHTGWPQGRDTAAQA